MKHLRPAIVLTLFFIVVTGLIFPGVLWAIGQAAFPDAANGSLIRDARGHVIGSGLIGQSFAKPEYFHPRPSAAGAGYDAANSSGTNLGPTSDKLIHGIDDDPSTPDADETYLGFTDLAKAYREENGLAPDAVLPADAVTRSGSGLDPHISPDNALLQVQRVAKARNSTPEVVRQLVAEHQDGRLLGFLGEPRVNVLLLNLALDQLEPGKLH
jgi:potassium-transporting ATPase KdpC subunit